MLTDLRRERGQACLSDLVFDEWHAGELSAGGEAAARAHVESCERCQRHKAELDAERERFRLRAPSWRPPVRVAARRGASLVARAGTGVALAAAAGVALFVALGPEMREPTGGEREASGDRIKGSHRLGFFVKRGAQTMEGVSGQRVLPGDQLRFVVTAHAPVYVAVLSLDGAGRASTYYPADGAQARRLDPAVAQPLEGAVELDAALGRERVWGVFCAKAFASEPLRQALETRGTLQAAPGCSLDEIALTKVAAP